MKIKMIFLFVIFAVPVFLSVLPNEYIYAQTDESVLLSDIEADTELIGGVYLINRPIMIHPEVTLTISNGTQIIVNGGGKIRVLGNLIIDNATSSSKIDIYVNEGSLQISDSYFHRLALYSENSLLEFNRLTVNTADDIYISGGAASFSGLNILNGKKFYITLGATVSVHDSVFSSMNDSTSAFMLFGGSVFNMSSTTISSSKNDTFYIDEESELKLNRVRIENYGNNGITAFGANIFISDSVIKTNIGKIGIDNVHSNIIVLDSLISGNSTYGIFSRNAEYTVDARNNFWGDKSGPHHQVNNIDGLGDRVSDNVLYDPWLKNSPFICCSNVIFLPGFQSSRLYTAGEVFENKLWEPNRGNDLDLLMMSDDGQSLQDIYVKDGDVIDELYGVSPGGNIYKSFLKDLNIFKDTEQINDWLAIPYDWRFSVVDFDFSEIIKEMASISKTGEVSIVAHSNGGLLAKSMMDKLSHTAPDLIDKVIFVAVPQVGTPTAIGSLLHGFKEGIPFIYSAGSMRSLGLTFPGAYNLLPSAKFFDLFSTSTIKEPVIKFSATSTVFGHDIANGEYLYDFLVGLDSRTKPAKNDLISASILNQSLLDKAQDFHDQADSWLPPIGTSLYQIAGIGIETVSGIDYYNGKKDGRDRLMYKPLFSYDGDGTVLASSALFLPEAENIKSIKVNLDSINKGFGINRYHADILEVPYVRKIITDILSYNPVQIIPELAVEAKQKNSTKVFIYGDNQDIGIVGSDGGYAGVSSTTDFIENNSDNVIYKDLGALKYVSIYESESIESGNGQNSSRINIISSDSENINIEVGQNIFTDIKVSTTTSILLDIVDDKPTVNIDYESDGFIDKEITPDDNIKVIEEPIIAQRNGQRKHELVLDLPSYIDIPVSVTEPMQMQIGQTPTTSIATTADISNPDMSNYNQTASVFSAVSVFPTLSSFSILDRLLQYISHYINWFFGFLAKTL